MDDFKVFTKEELEAEIKKFQEEMKINKTKLSLNWMDSYVLTFFPEKAKEWGNKCAAIPKAIRKNGKEAKNVERVREAFIKEFFPDYTDEAIKKRKEEKIAKRKAEKEEKEHFKSLSPEEQIELRLKKMREIIEQREAEAKKAEEET